jgi:hypothetical protein
MAIMTDRRFSASKALVLWVFLISALRAQAPTKALDRLVGRDLWKNPIPVSAKTSLKEIIGEVPKGDIVAPAPWHVWKTNRNGKTKYVVLLVESEMSVPGDSSACIRLFDGAARMIASWSFPTGHRMTPTRASMNFSSELEGDLIVIEMGRFINGRDVGREYFSLRDDRLQLVRIEDQKGKATQNEYVLSGEIGIIPDANTADDWTRLLESKAKTDVLSALVFLGGRHLDGPDRDFGVGPHSGKYVGLFQQLVSNARIHETIERLSKGDDEWIRQAAQLAARGPRDRLYR